jgi:hypothetical protein
MTNEPVKRKMTMIPEPEDKLDAIMVSGPEDASLAWRRIDWRQVEQNVRPSGFGMCAPVA